tara:strand:+ start:571 stop:1077 length:507 start_codon:yes stop_codon:yes gene_type:complete
MCEEIKSLRAENAKLKEEIDGDTFLGINQGLKKEKSNLILQQKRMVKEIAKLEIGFWGINQGLKKEKSDLILQQKRMVKEIVKLEKENESSDKYIDILEERCSGIHNRYCCGNSGGYAEPRYNIPMEEIDERLKMDDNIDLTLAPLFRIMKHQKEEIKKLKAENEIGP